MPFVFSVRSGCRGAIVVAEARSADEPSLTRRCVIMKVQDFTTEKYLQAQTQQAAAILILLPQNLSSVPFDTIKVASPPERPAGDDTMEGGGLSSQWSIRTVSPQNFKLSEREALMKETLIPVYVVPEDEQLLYMYEEVKQAAAMHASSIFYRGERRTGRNVPNQASTRMWRDSHASVSVLRSMVTATAFQILVSNNAPIKAITDNAVVTLEVRPPTHRRGVSHIWTMSSGL